LKNEATDLYENKGSAPGEIRNEATVEGGKRSAEGSRQSHRNWLRHRNEAVGCEWATIRDFAADG